MTGPTRRALLAVALVAMLVLAGCSGGGDAAPAGQEATAGDPPAEAESGGDGGGRDGAGGDGGGAADGTADGRADGQQRHRVRTGEATVRVEAFDGATDDLAATTRRLGGFVADSERRRHRSDDATWLTGRLVLRVPAGNFSALRAGVAAEGTVLHSSSSVEDVTGQVVDLQARLSNLRAQRDRLRGLYEEANETEDVLAVGRRLSDTQAEIERLEGELAALEDRVAYSTLTVELREPEPDAENGPAAADAWYETDALDALVDSAAGVVTTLRMLVVAGAYLLPYLAVFGAPVLAVVAWRRRRGGPTDAGSAAGGSAGESSDGEGASGERAGGDGAAGSTVEPDEEE